MIFVLMVCPANKMKISMKFILNYVRLSVSPLQMLKLFIVSKLTNPTNTTIKKNNKDYDGAIIIKFKCPYERNFILKTITSFIKAKKDVLRLNLIGFDSSNPFFVNENLTPENHRIFLQAYNLKKKYIVSSAFTNRGLVYISKSPNDEPICIDDIAKLNLMFRFQNNNNASMPTSQDNISEGFQSSGAI